MLSSPALPVFTERCSFSGVRDVNDTTDPTQTRTATVHVLYKGPSLPQQSLKHVKYTRIGDL